MDRPNLLFIFTDQQRFDTLRCYDNRYVQAPNLDKLACCSFVFENAYVTQPVCTPSRSSLMSGLWPHSNGCTANNIPLRPETRTFAEMAPADYARGYVGKWHLGDEVIPQHGFTHWVSIEDSYRGYYSKPEYRSRFSDYHAFLMGNGITPDVRTQDAPLYSRRLAASLPVELSKAAFVGQETAAFIRKQRDAPFMLVVNFLEPHTPNICALESLYDPDKIPLGPAFLKPPAHAPFSISDRYENKIVDGRDLSREEGFRGMRAAYYGQITLMDRAVGEILRALEDSGAADRTIVVFTADHGDMLGDHGLLRKCVMYEEAVKAPMLLRVPWLADSQTRVRGNFSHIDVTPTLLDLLGLPIPEEVQGLSRVATLREAQPSLDEDVFIEWNSPDAPRPYGANPSRTIVSADRWKLNLHASGNHELYDLSNDPHEMRNRIDDGGVRSRVRDMTARLRAWQAKTGDRTRITAPA